MQKEIIVRNLTKRIFVLDFIFDNRAKDNYLIQDIKMIFKRSKHSFSAVSKYITNSYNQKSYQSDIISIINLVEGLPIVLRDKLEGFL